MNVKVGIKYKSKGYDGAFFVEFNIEFSGYLW